MAAEVGKLTRNVKIRGQDYNNGRTMAQQGFGGRVLVSSYAAGDTFKTGQSARLAPTVTCRPNGRFLFLDKHIIGM